MFRVVCERKCAKERLEAMTNRIQSLRLAEIRANKKLTEVRKLADAKASLREQKAREEEEKRRWKQQVQENLRNSRLKVVSERMGAKEKVQQARDSLRNLKRVTVT